MKQKTIDTEISDVLPEYDFGGDNGIRGKHAQAMRAGYSIHVEQDDGTLHVQDFPNPQNTIVLDTDVCAYFPTSESVNQALRALIALIPEKKPGVGESKMDFGQPEK